MTDTSSVQSPGLESGSLIVGRIRPPMAMWAALEGIAKTTPVRNGVLIIFSQNLRGRIGVFCNRYISGAVIESGSTGMDAVRELLSVKGGMFGFRACMADEWNEVGQSLGVDIDELLLSRSDKDSADEALKGLMVPGSQLLRSSDLADPVAPEEAAESAETEDKGEEPAAEEPAKANGQEGKEDFSYLDWFADQMGEREKTPKFRQILMTALPKAVEGVTPAAEVAQTADAEEPQAAEPEPEMTDLQMYGRLLQSEQDKVTRDIERSLERGRTGTADGAEEDVAVEEAVSDLKLLSEFIHAEQNRAQKWQGLDDIPTPNAGSGTQSGARANMSQLRTSQRMRAVNFEETGDTQQDVDNLLATSMSRVTLPKDFVKTTGSLEVSGALRKLDVSVSWWQRPPVIAALSITAIVGLVMAISSHQATAAFQATLGDARRGLQDNPGAAANVLTKAIDQNPTSARAYFYRGIAYGAAGDYDKSMNDLDTAFTRGQDPKVVWLAKAASACRNAHYTEALTACDQVLKLDPSNAQALSLKTISTDLQKAETTSVVVAKPRVQPVEKPSTTKPVVKRPVSLSVISDAMPSNNKMPTDARGLITLGYDYLRSGDKRSAMQCFAEAVKRSPNNTDARRYLAHVLADEGNAAAAVQQFNALVSLQALRATDAVAYATALGDTGNETRAMEVLAHFVGQTPNDLQMRIELVRLYSNAGYAERADQLYRESLPLATTGEARRLLDEAHGGDSGNEAIHIRRR